MADIAHQLHEATTLLLRAYEHEDDEASAPAEDSFERVAVGMAERILELEAHAEFLKARAAKLGDRRARLLTRAHAYRRALLTALEAAGLKRLPAAELTITRTATAPKIIVVDQDQLPASCFRQKAPEPDLVEIGRRIKAGEAIPGVVLGNGGQTITITTS